MEDKVLAENQESHNGSGDASKFAFNPKASEFRPSYFLPPRSVDAEEQAEEYGQLCDGNGTEGNSGLSPSLYYQLQGTETEYSCQEQEQYIFSGFPTECQSYPTEESPKGNRFRRPVSHSSSNHYQPKQKFWKGRRSVRKEAPTGSQVSSFQQGSNQVNMASTSNNSPLLVAPNPTGPVTFTPLYGLIGYVPTPTASNTLTAVPTPTTNSYSTAHPPGPISSDFPPFQNDMSVGQNSATTPSYLQQTPAVSTPLQQMTSQTSTNPTFTNQQFFNPALLPPGQCVTVTVPNLPNGNSDQTGFPSLIPIIMPQGQYPPKWPFSSFQN